MGRMGAAMMAATPFEPGGTDATQVAQAQRARKIAEAMAFLRVAMAIGPRPAAEVKAEALAAGHTHTTLATARARLSIRSKRQGNQWVWIPPRGRKRQPVTA
jgi:hypothetical protein